MGEREYLDVEIRVFPEQVEGEYPVELTVAGEETYPRGGLAVELLPWISSGEVALDGRRLFDALLAGEGPRRGWLEARGRSFRRRVRLWLDAAAPSLHTLPWELLRDAGAWLAADADTPFSRYLPVAEPWGATRTVPLRVLAVVSAPADIEVLYGLSLVDIEAERTLLENVFFPLEGDALQLDILEPPVTLSRLEGALQQGYDVLHYVGHGTYNARRHQTALYLQDEDGGAAPVSDRALLEMLQRKNRRPLLVTLMACQSAVRAAGAFLGLGPRLLLTGVPAVLAMQDRVTVKSARIFSTAFYRNLVKQGVVDLAVNQARSRLLSEGRLDAGVPVLFMRLRSGRLWSRSGAGSGVLSAPGLQVQGDVSGQAAVSGSGSVTQIGEMRGGEVNLGTPSTPTASRDELALGELQVSLDDLRRHVASDVPAAERDAALQTLAALEAAISADPPDLRAMAAAQTWFRDHAPRLVGALRHNVLLHPALHKRVAASGADRLRAYRRRFLEA